ncbi:MAG: LacI family DNA-binding transcriptional regulator [Eubacteriales bacterium]|nr:LacI family DNA-binding transcriptional regulator [Eubacteriales bacterium]
MNSTIYDVSRLSGVSTATVSRVFSDPERVREGTRRSVLEAAEVLHYHPNAIARAMAKQRTDKIAFLICKQRATILDEFYAGICDGIMQETNKTDYQLLISTADAWKTTAGTAQRKQIEGVILGGNAQADMVLEFQNQHIAVVLVNSRIPGLDLPCVLSDEEGGVRQIVEHLWDRGHTRIAMLAGRLSPYISSERYNAFLKAMRQKGIPVDSQSVKMCSPDVESATRAATELLTGSRRPSAIFASNDVIASGTLKAAARLKVKVPEELAVVGYDDSALCTMLEPEMTSVHTHRHRMGRLCVERLTALLKGEELTEPTTILPAELVIRGTT